MYVQVIVCIRYLDSLQNAVEILIIIIILSTKLFAPNNPSISKDLKSKTFGRKQHF